MQASSKNFILAAFWVLLLLMPLALLLSHSQLFPMLDLKGDIAQIFYGITMTGTTPWGIGFILVILAICLRLLPRRLFVQLFLAVAISQSAGLVLNHAVKPLFHEARPNIQWLAGYMQINKGYFYSQDKPQRQRMMREAINVNARTLPMSKAIANHWVREVSYSFPSGHTQFAVSFALIVSFYLLSAGIVSMPLLMLGWALLMGLSRMFLGLHWAQDVLASTLVGGILAWITLVLVQTLSPKLLDKVPLLNQSK